MSNSTLPGHEQQSSDILCSSCGRFVGALTKCPHCGAKVTKRLSVRMTRYAAVLLAVIGLALLYAMAISRDIPQIKIEDIKSTMNFAYVQIEGAVVQDARFFRNGGLGFVVDDGTGEISVSAFRMQANKMVEAGVIPRAGDRIKVAGSLSISGDDDLRLTIQVVEQVQISPAEVVRVPLGELSVEDAGSSVVVEGRISKVSAPPPGQRRPWSITLNDETGSGNVTFWDSVYAELADNRDKLVPGQPLRMRVRVDSYRGTMQLSPSSGHDFEFLEAAATAVPKEAGRKSDLIPLSSITEEMKDERVETEGTVVDFQVPEAGTKQPYRITLQEGDATVSVIFWEKVAEEMGEVRPATGSRMHVRGQVDAYRGQIQIKVNFRDQMQFNLVQPIEKVPVPESTPIGGITESDVGEMRTVSGELGADRAIRGGVIYPLKDASGTLQLVLWDRFVPGPSRDRLAAGKKITATGKVNLYEENLQIIPENSSALIVH